MNCMSYGSVDITSQGWILFFMTLQDSNLNLIKLSLGINIIDDEGMQLLVRLISSMDSLKYFSLLKTKRVTPTGWQALAGYLQSPNFALEELDLNYNNINDDTVIALTRALSQNKTLERLGLDECHDEDDVGDEGDLNFLITVRGREAVSTLLCNKTSIMDTYNSNHTLNYVYCEYLPDDLLSYLKLNENEDKTEVARQKILQTHFSVTEDDDTPNIQEFIDMELEVMPTAIAWIGRPTHDWKGTTVSGLSTIYNLLRRLPDLFDPTSQKSPGKEEA